MVTTCDKSDRYQAEEKDLQWMPTKTGFSVRLSFAKARAACNAFKALFTYFTWRLNLHYIDTL